VDTLEAKTLAENNPYSYLRIVRPELEFMSGHNPYAEDVYRRARANLLAFIQNGTLIQEAEPSLYIYQLHREGHVQTGLAGLTAVDDYERGLIKIHEKTRVDKELDRTKHIITAGAHTEPVFLAYRDDPALTSLIMAETLAPPLYDFTSDDGVKHVLWKAAETQAIQEAFAALPYLYIADGHHRAAAALRCRGEMRSRNPAHQGHEPYNYFLSVTFPHHQLKILPYHRIVRGMSEDPSAVLTSLDLFFALAPTQDPSPPSKGRVCMFFQGRWYSLELLKDTPPPVDPVEALDVSLLYSRVLVPFFGIGDPRIDKNLDFVGGGHGVAELERLVKEGKAVAAFSLFPVSIQELFAVADQGGCMAPKSTWFEPKLRSGLLVHMFW